MKTAYVRRVHEWCQTVDVDRPNDRVVLHELSRYDLFDGGAFPSHAELAKRLKLSVSTVRQALYRLRDRDLVEVSERCRKNGSQASNTYLLKVPNRVNLGATPATPHVTLELLATTAMTHGENDSSSKSHARAAHHKIKQGARTKAKAAGVNDFHDDFDDGHVIGAMPTDPAAPTKRRKPRVRSGNNVIAPKPKKKFDPLHIVETPRQAQARHNVMKLAEERRTTPVERWSAYDLAQAWRERLWAKGMHTHHSNLLALAARFTDLRADGVSNARMEEISEMFFADRRRWRSLPGETLYRAFLAQTEELLAVKAKNSSIMDMDMWARMAAEYEAKLDTP